jgi:membrane-associated phospholipid phosphatase
VGILAFLVVVVAAGPLRAQEAALPDAEGLLIASAPDTSRALIDSRMAPGRPAWHAMVTNLPGDWATFPATVFQPSGITAMAGLGILTGALVLTEGQSYRGTRQLLDANPSAQHMCDIMEHVGDGRLHLGIAAAFGIAGFAADDSRALRTASQTVEALLATGVTVQILKRMTGRESPQVALREGGVWHLFPSVRDYDHHQSRYYAFPSGHIATTMSTVTVIAENYPEVRWIRPVGYTFVGLLGISLVGVQYHWYSDLPLGIALGYTFGSIVTRHDGGAERAESGAPVHALSIVPTLGPTGTGIALALSL